jgi:hypothetical protein
MTWELRRPVFSLGFALKASQKIRSSDLAAFSSTSTISTSGEIGGPASVNSVDRVIYVMQQRRRASGPSGFDKQSRNGS